ncbi:MAG: phosphoribosylformylglycinamidine synthase subunit PurL, partial [Thaumarchaeota archaeon]|nr:phosphoribosylformylglycinamidine synthase subunit PurL [Nitrososphaerota archaeon]
MSLDTLQLGLSASEIDSVRRNLGREPNETEWSIIDAEWSEHSSYKSSRALLKLFPTKGERVVLGPGYDAGVVDVGSGYVVTLHIESHNHPSAVDPYGGASTGIGGVLRDILSMGTRPIALVDILRFGRIDKSPNSRWLFRNVVRGIADYGNCTGVPTVAGDIEFDESFERNCLVDVACVGLGRKEDLILGEARTPGDLLVLIGGSTGRDGIRGATFASKNLSKSAEEDRSSVQVPDPFMKKLLLDALMEAVPTRLIRGMKDLGGGGLSTALSEIASNGGTGVDVELSEVNRREQDMSPTEIMISESQERMLLVLSPGSSDPIVEILRKYEIPYSIIGRVTDDGNLTIRWKRRVVAKLPAEFVVKAPLIPWPSRRPSRLDHLSRTSAPDEDIGRAIASLVSSPNIASRRWVYQQYDHEVGVRTVVKPGQADAALIRLPNGALLAVKGDGNSAHSSLDPYRGAAGCVAEACRNVVAVGAEPIALVDHLQFGDPSDPEVYWSLSESVRGMADYCTSMELPVVGGKVSLYNEDSSSKVAIKPSPIALVVGLVKDQKHPVSMGFKGKGESLIVVGETRAELGGSEYHRLLGMLDS